MKDSVQSHRRASVKLDHPDTDPEKWTLRTLSRLAPGTDRRRIGQKAVVLWDAADLVESVLMKGSAEAIR